jgi:hypothetical protein
MDGVHCIAHSRPTQRNRRQMELGLEQPLERQRG